MTYVTYICAAQVKLAELNVAQFAIPDSVFSMMIRVQCTYVFGQEEAIYRYEIELQHNQANFRYSTLGPIVDFNFINYAAKRASFPAIIYSSNLWIRK